jgi:cellulose synthase/poly-beta-1,6-N-acetylglucosamine synthase-like glycosyltransferase
MSLANASIVEDMKLGIDLAVAGHPSLFCPEVRVSSEFPLERHAARTQRTRWEHGHLDMILSQLPRLVMRAFIARDLRLLGLALDLAVPPLALLATWLLALAGAGLVLKLFGSAPWFFAFTVSPLCLATAAILVAWRGWGRNLVAAEALWAVPRYVLAKFPLYLRFLAQRQKSWVKTARD